MGGELGGMGKWVDVGQGYKLSVISNVSAEILMYSMVSLVNTACS